MGLVKSDENNIIQPSSDDGISSSELISAKKDTFSNRTAISPVSYPEVYGTLLSYTTGVPVSVEYFKQRVPYTDRQTIDTSFSLERSSVHTSYDLIHEFEIKVQDELQPDVDSETAETTLTGTALIYPGFFPNPGDVFYLRLPDEQIGVFVVNDVRPISIQRGSHYEIQFHLYSYLDDQVDDKLRQSVAEELWFDKKSYFSSEASLLTDKSYRQLETLVSTKRDLLNYLTTRFYKRGEKTIFRPGDIFDMYVVEFLNETTSITETKYEICQMSLNHIDAFYHTIFGALLKQDVTQLIYTGCTLHHFKNFIWDTNISNMDKYRVVSVRGPYDEVIEDRRYRPAKFDTLDDTPREVSYHFSNRFYYTLLKSFEQGSLITDFTGFDEAVLNDGRFYSNLTDEFYSLTDRDYRPLSEFTTTNPQGLPELELMVLEFILKNHIDVGSFVDQVLGKFPFPNMKETDLFYYLPIILHLSSVAIQRTR